MTSSLVPLREALAKLVAPFALAFVGSLLPICSVTEARRRREALVGLPQRSRQAPFG
jgi:hypothetical protein